MKHVTVSDFTIPRVVMGCMHLAELDRKSACDLIETAFANSMNFFDHADVYGGGTCESLFADAIEALGVKREKMILQSKCGIVKRNDGSAYYDFSGSHIVKSVEESLKRLRTDYLDILLLHRPDTLLVPDEIAEAFDTLHTKGMVRFFGVSNCNPTQMELIQSAVTHKLLFNQLQFSLGHPIMAGTGLAVNMTLDQSTERSGGILEYCRLKGIAIQAWSPLQRGFFDGPYLGDRDHYAELNGVIERLAHEYAVSPTAIAIAWILRHPGIQQAITGTMNRQRFLDCAAGADIDLSRDEWYALFTAAGGMIP